MRQNRFCHMKETGYKEVENKTNLKPSSPLRDPSILFHEAVWPIATVFIAHFQQSETKYHTPQKCTTPVPPTRLDNVT